MHATIEPTTSIEELLDVFPHAVSIMLRNDLPCLVCGEPVWGTIRELAERNGWSAGKLTTLVEELNRSYSQREVR
jgi:hypothetical protein